MSCYYIYKEKQYKELDDLYPVLLGEMEEQASVVKVENGKETTVKINTELFPDKRDKVLKPGVEEVFQEKPELASIGTQQQYSAYLETIFPDSKVKDIVYHGSKNTVKTGKRIENFDVKESWGTLLYFTKDRGQAVNYALYDEKGVYQVILNIKNPTIEIDDKVIEKPVNSDGYVRDYTREYVMSLDEHVSDFVIEEITVPNSAQVHILGSKQDIEGFKEFVQGKQFQKLTDFESRDNFSTFAEEAFECK